MIEIYVLPPGHWENELLQNPDGIRLLGDWWAVVGENGIVAYAATEGLADAILRNCSSEIRGVS